MDLLLIINVNIIEGEREILKLSPVELILAEILGNTSITLAQRL